MSLERPALAYVVHSLDPGGTEKLVANMSLAFSTEFEVSVLCLDEPGLWANELRAHKVPVYALWRQPGLDVLTAARLAAYFRRFRTQIVHAHQCTPWFYSALARLIYRYPRLLLQEHGRAYPEHESWKRVLVNRLLITRLTHRFTAVSEDVARRLERYEGLTRQDIEVIYNGVSAPRGVSEGERHAMRQALGFSPGDFIIGTIGRLDPVKNLPLLINSLAAVAQEMPNARGLLVGDGPAFVELQELIGRLGLAGRVVMTGFREDARQLLQCLDLFVLCSFSEGTSVALLEAMAAGVPMIATNVGGNPEVVIKDENGWLIPSDSVEALSSAIRHAAHDPGERARRGAAGKERYRKKFAFEVMLDGYRKLYQDMLWASSQVPQPRHNA